MNLNKYLKPHAISNVSTNVEAFDGHISRFRAKLMHLENDFLGKIINIYVCGVELTVSKEMNFWAYSSMHDPLSQFKGFVNFISNVSGRKSTQYSCKRGGIITKWP
jgi:hypothetical protein